MNNSVLVVIETDEGGGILPASLEALNTGRMACEKTGAPLNAALIGSKVAGAADTLKTYLAGAIYTVESDLLEGYQPELTAHALGQIIGQADPGVVLFSHTLTAIDLAPRAAVDRDAGLVMDCVGIDLDGDELVFNKPVFSSNVMAVYSFDSAPGFVTMRARSAEPAEPLSGASAEIKAVDAGLSESLKKVEVLDRIKEDDGSVKLASADIIVAGGRGMGGPEGFDVLKELAEALNGALGASRPPCDLEWVSPKLQVGLTGEIVAPALYIAVGISGSFQHLAGITDSKVIVAVNNDEKAYIFKVADYGVVGDYEEVIPAFLEAVRGAD